MQGFFSLSNESCFVLVTLVLSNKLSNTGKFFPQFVQRHLQKGEKKLFALLPNAMKTYIF